ncbi:MAG: FprA family A-type flavoprotein [Halanaerobiaceae bacterium]
MTVNKIKENIFAFRTLDWDRRLFDELIPLPDGTTYNSFLIKGKNKNILIDTTYIEKSDILLNDLEQTNVEKIDYIVSNHSEPDHSGTIPKLLKLFPEARVITNEKGKNTLQNLLLIDDNKFKVIEDGEEFSTGDKTLKFIDTPWVHWPETMVTYLKEDNILFTCDFFGSHLAQSPLYAEDRARVYEAAKRYYAEIMMPFRKVIKSNLKKVNNLEIDLIAPSHGPLYQDPDFIIKAYEDWISDEVKNEVVIPYVSMYGSTETMVNHLIDKLIKKNIKAKPFNVIESDIGELAKALVDAATIVIGSPTVLTGPHPGIQNATYLANALRPKVKYASIIGSYGWAGKMEKMLKEMIPKLDVELIEPVIIKGRPQSQDLEKINKLSETILDKHKKEKII